MEKTALTVGGFTQPSVARNIIEQNTGAERGFSQRFLWIFTKPTFAKFASLKPVPDEINEAIGTVLAQNLCTTLYGGSCLYFFLVELLTNVWTTGGGDKPVLQTWLMPSECADFQAKFDQVQEQLEDLCGMDDLLTGV